MRDDKGLLRFSSNLPVLETITLLNLIIHLFYIKLFIPATALRIGNEDRMGAIAMQSGQESGMAPLVPTYESDSLFY
jgi:hypothetical protein